MSSNSSVEDIADSNSRFDYSQRGVRAQIYFSAKNEFEELEATTSDLTVETGRRYSQILKRINQVPIDDADTDEILLFTSTSNIGTKFLIDKLPTLKVCDNQVTLESFIKNLNEKVKRNGWEDVMKPFDFLRSSVSFQILNIRRQERTVEVSNKEKKQRQKRTIQETGPAFQPSQITASESSENQNLHVDIVLDSLKKYHHQIRKPVALWQFVIDPDSFENTVENLFCVNILVNGSKAQLITDMNNGELFLEPIKQTNNQASQMQKTQKMLGFNHELYQKYIDSYNIREAIIKRPAEEDD